LRKDLLGHLQEEALAESKLPTDLFSKQCYELSHRILPMLLRYEDKNGMAYSIETRLPFLDPGLVAFLLNLPVHLKVNKGWSKHILRKGMEGRLPAEILWRKGKVGFEAISSQQLLQRINLAGNWPSSFWPEAFTKLSLDDMSGEHLWRGNMLARWQKNLLKIE
jgi:asparagine synthase (glutamine-hydrolysing)